MTDDCAESRRDDQPGERVYEPPTIRDFGLIREITHGSTAGGSDSNGQEN